MHMQDAYFVDQQKIGNWSDIGYTSPASSNFTYGGETAVTGDTWTAEAKFDTDGKCTTNIWKITVSATSKSISYQASDNCPALTPNFKKIGTSS